MRPATRLTQLESYAFDDLDRLRDARQAEGADVIDFGVGDPVDPTPDLVVEAAQASLERHRRSGYPAYHGSAAFRTAVVEWIGRHAGQTLDPHTQVMSSLGSKEAIFHQALACVDAGDVVLVPSPGYPPYAHGARFAGGRVVTYPVSMEGSVLPDLDALSDEDARRLKVVWITQPHVPTGRMARRDELRRLAEQCRERDVLLCSDEAYLDLWFKEPPTSALECGVENVLVFQSLSKRALMTGYRVGFVAGDAEALAGLRQLKLNIDSGTPHFVQDAAVAALASEAIPAAARRTYRLRADVMLKALRDVGCSVERPEAGFYLWAAVPEGTGVDFARRLLEESPALLAMPGEWLAEPVADTVGQPGDGRIRVALVPSLKRCTEAAERLSRW